MDRSHLWHTCFKMNLQVLEMNAAGITDEMAAHRPAPQVSSPAWILGHLTHSRHGLLAQLGGPALGDSSWKEAYNRGGEGEKAHLGFAELCGAFRATTEPLQEALRSVPDWDAPAKNPVSGGEQSLEQFVAFLYMHECYHLGQVGLMRKLYGLKGAV